MAKKIKVFHSEDAFGRIYDKAKFGKPVKRNANLLFVFVRGRTSHQKAVEVGEDNGTSSGDFVYKYFEHLSSVPQAEMHNDVFKLSKRGSDCRWTFDCASWFV